MKYKNNEIKKTNITTSITKKCYGQNYDTIGYLYEITGKNNSPARQRPLLTSIKDCKNYITKEQDYLKQLQESV